MDSQFIQLANDLRLHHAEDEATWLVDAINPVTRRQILADLAAVLGVEVQILDQYKRTDDGQVIDVFKVRAKPDPSR